MRGETLFVIAKRSFLFHWPLLCRDYAFCVEEEWIKDGKSLSHYDTYIDDKNKLKMDLMT